jgi:hypothetical protein
VGRIEVIPHAHHPLTEGSLEVLRTLESLDVSGDPVVAAAAAVV